MAWTAEAKRAYYQKNREKFLAANNKRRKERRREIREAVKSFKLKTGCAQCGYADHPDALQFDHIVPLGICKRNRAEAKRNIPDTWAKLDRLFKDPNVQVLCANCHSIKTVTEAVDRWTVEIGV